MLKLGISKSFYIYKRVIFGELKLSINGVNQNTDIQKLLKLMKANKGANAGMSKKVDSRMTKDGSIFAKTVSSTSNNKSTISSNNSIQSRTIGNVQSANVAKSISNVSATSSTSASTRADETKSRDNNEKLDLSL